MQRQGRQKKEDSGFSNWVRNIYIYKKENLIIGLIDYWLPDSLDWMDVITGNQPYRYESEVPSYYVSISIPLNSMFNKAISIKGNGIVFLTVYCIITLHSLLF